MTYHQPKKKKCEPNEGFFFLIFSIYITNLNNGVPLKVEKIHVVFFGLLWLCLVMRKFKGKCEEKKIKKRKIKGKKIKNGFKFNELFLYASPNSFHFFFFHYSKIK